MLACSPEGNEVDIVIQNVLYLMWSVLWSYYVTHEKKVENWYDVLGLSGIEHQFMFYVSIIVYLSYYALLAIQSVALLCWRHGKDVFTSALAASRRQYIMNTKWSCILCFIPWSLTVFGLMQTLSSTTTDMIHFAFVHKLLLLLFDSYVVCNCIKSARWLNILWLVSQTRSQTVNDAVGAKCSACEPSRNVIIGWPGNLNNQFKWPKTRDLTFVCRNQN